MESTKTVKKNIEEYLKNCFNFRMILQNKFGEETYAKIGFIKAIDQIDLIPKLILIKNNIIKLEPLRDVESFLYEAKFEYLFDSVNKQTKKLNGTIRVIVRGFGDPKYFDITKAELTEN
jgi:hypothetical protein